MAPGVDVVCGLPRRAREPRMARGGERVAQIGEHDGLPATAAQPAVQVDGLAESTHRLGDVAQSGVGAAETVPCPRPDLEFVALVADRQCPLEPLGGLLVRAGDEVRDAEVLLASRASWRPRANSATGECHTDTTTVARSQTIMSLRDPVRSPAAPASSPRMPGAAGRRSPLPTQGTGRAHGERHHVVCRCDETSQQPAPTINVAAHHPRSCLDGRLRLARSLPAMADNLVRPNE